MREEEKRKIMIKCAEEADEEQRKLVEKSLREEEKEIDNKIKKLCDEFNYSWKDWEDYFPTGIKKLLDQALSSQLKEVEERIFQDVNIPAEVCKYIREKILAEVEKLV